MSADQARLLSAKFRVRCRSVSGVSLKNLALQLTTHPGNGSMTNRLPVRVQIALGADRQLEKPGRFEAHMPFAA